VRGVAGMGAAEAMAVAASTAKRMTLALPPTGLRVDAEGYGRRKSERADPGKFMSRTHEITSVAI